MRQGLVWFAGFLVLLPEVALLVLFAEIIPLTLANLLLNPWVIGPVLGYIAFWGNSRAVTLIPIPLIPLAVTRTGVATQSLTILLVYIICWLSAFAALDFGEADMVMLVKHADRHIGICLKPFGSLQLLVRRVLPKHSNRLWPVMTVLLSLSLGVVFPLVVARGFESSSYLEWLLAIGLIYLLLVRIELLRAMQRLALADGPR